MFALLVGGVAGARAADKPMAGAARGFTYQHDEIPEKPWSIHVVKVDRSNSELELETSLGGGNHFGLATLSEQMRAWPRENGHPVAAINGDYFYGGFAYGGFYHQRYPFPGDPKGIQIVRGELVSGPCDWTCLWIDAAGSPHMTNVASRFEVTWPGGEKTPFELNKRRTGDTAVLFTAAAGASTRTGGGRELVLERNGTNAWLPLQVGVTYSARVREVRDAGNTPLDTNTMVLSIGDAAVEHAARVAPGAVLEISTATSPDMKGAKTAIGGGPALVRAGRATGRLNSYFRNPRAAVGFNQHFFFLVEVDGRQSNLSIGMNDTELAGYLTGLGCEEAMSFDGGGSATCWIYGQVMNSPSEGRERPMANALVLVHKEKQ